MDSVLWLEIPRSRTTIECNVMLLVSCALDILHIYKLLAHYGISLLSSPPARRRLSYCTKSLNVDIYPQHSCSLLLGSHVSSSFSCSSCTSFLLPRVLVPFPFAFLCMSHSLDNLIILFCFPHHRHTLHIHHKSFCHHTPFIHTHLHSYMDT